MSSEKIVFGVHIPPQGLDFESMKKTCLEVERLGFDLFTVTDHFMNMAQPDGPNSRHPLECWSTLAGLAAVTSEIRLGPLVSCYGYRHPTVLAKMATTVDIISDGRLIFGIGAGWHQKEFEGFMGHFPSVSERMRGLEETVQICRNMFTKERTSFRGELYEVDNVLNSPLPIQRPPPTMVGGGGLKRTLRIAAKYADISHFAFSPTEEVLNQKLTALRNHCKDVGRDFNEIKKGIGVYLVVGDTEEEIEDKIRSGAERRNMNVMDYRNRVGSIKGSPEQLIKAISNYIHRGVNLFTISISATEDIKLFAEEIMPEFT